MAGWRVWGEPLYTAHFSGAPVYYQRVKFNGDDNFVLRGMKTWVIVFNSPVFTSLEMRVYSDRNAKPGDLLYTSSSTQILSAITGSAYAAIEIFFNFDALPSFDKGDNYHFVLWGNGYTGTSGSHIAWKKAFPDSMYAVTGATLDCKHLGVWPYDISFIGDSL